MSHDLRLLAAVFAGGCAGALLRTGVAELLPAEPGGWPWPTLAVNVVGAFLLGALVTRLHERSPASGYALPLLGTGLCGALTTFSTMQLELLQMLDAGAWARAAAYAAISLGLGLVAVRLAASLVRRRPPVRA